MIHQSRSIDFYFDENVSSYEYADTIGKPYVAGRPNLECTFIRNSGASEILHILHKPSVHIFLGPMI